jgi:hypothetical protein
MKMSTNLVKLACLLPATFLIAEASLACPFRSTSAGSAGRHTTVMVRHGSNYQLVPVSFDTQAEPFGFIGVAIEPLSPERAQEMNQERGFFANLFSSDQAVPEVEGVLVIRTLENGPADLMGLLEGDVILGVNGELVRGVQQVQQLISRTRVGQDVPLTFRRGDEVRTVLIQTGDGRYLKPLMLNQ